MPKKEKEFDVDTRGTGKPDFTGKVDDIRTGYVYGQFTPRLNERWKIFLAAYPVGSELGAGKSEKFVDIETNLPVDPYTSPVGWYIRFAAAKFTFDQKVRVEYLFGQKLIPSLPKITLFPPVQNIFAYNEQISYLDTRYWDPLAVDEHEYTLTITNISGSDATGFSEAALIMERVGSPEMKDKRVRCLKCGYINTVPIDQTKITCEGCGYIFLVPFYGRGIV